MTALQSIIKEAKAIRKKSPKMEWKKAVAKASAIYASKHKGKSPVGKKKVKKHVVKKKAVKKVGVIKKKSIKKTATKRKPTEKAVLKSIKHAVSVQKSHMGSVGAINKHALHELKENLWKNAELKKVIPELQYLIKNPPINFTKNDINLCKKEIRQAKMYIKENNIHIKELKKLI